MSDRFIRKAEAGGPIEAASVAVLAVLYSSPEHPVRPRDLLADGSILPLWPEQPNSRLLWRWLDDIWNKGRLETIDELTAEQLRFRCETGTLRSTAELRRRIREMRRAFREFHLTVRDITESGELVVSRWRMTMVHSGNWRGLAPTHRRVSAWGTTSVRIEAERITEGWEFWDPQLGYPQAKASS